MGRWRSALFGAVRLESATVQPEKEVFVAGRPGAGCVPGSSRTGRRGPAAKLRLAAGFVAGLPVVPADLGMIEVC